MRIFSLHVIGGKLISTHFLIDSRAKTARLASKTAKYVNTLIRKNFHYSFQSLSLASSPRLHHFSVCPATVAGVDCVLCLVKAQVRSALSQPRLDVCDGKINFSEKLFLSARLFSRRCSNLCLRSLFTGVWWNFVFPLLIVVGIQSFLCVAFDANHKIERKENFLNFWQKAEKIWRKTLLATVSSLTGVVDFFADLRQC